MIRRTCHVTVVWQPLARRLIKRCALPKIARDDLPELKYQPAETRGHMVVFENDCRARAIIAYKVAAMFGSMRLGGHGSPWRQLRRCGGLCS
jgi:hypothetical protein